MHKFTTKDDDGSRNKRLKPDVNIIAFFFNATVVEDHQINVHIHIYINPSFWISFVFIRRKRGSTGLWDGAVGFKQTQAPREAVDLFKFYQWLFTLCWSCYCCSYLLVQMNTESPACLENLKYWSGRKWRKLTKGFRPLTVTHPAQRLNGLFTYNTNSCYRNQTAMRAKDPADLLLLCFYFSCVVSWSTLLWMERRPMSQGRNVKLGRRGVFLITPAPTPQNLPALCAWSTSLLNTFPIRHCNKGNSVVWHVCPVFIELKGHSILFFFCHHKDYCCLWKRLHANGILCHFTSLGM